jgi:glutamate racemase
MNIGVFDSGLGGLWILKHLRETLPQYHYVFFGDQAHVPYGNKTVAELLEYTTKALTYLYEQKNCACVLLACNTTSATIYNELREWVEKHYPGRRIFGVVRPTVLATPTNDPIVVFATSRTVESHAYKDMIKVETTTEIALPELASRIENGEETQEYILSFASVVPGTARTGILGCTHYGIVRSDFIKAFPQIQKWISQEEIIPKLFKEFFESHKEFTHTLSKEGDLELYVSKESEIFNQWLTTWFSNHIKAVVL